MKKISFNKILLSIVSLITATVIACPTQVFAYSDDIYNVDPDSCYWLVSSESTGPATAIVSVMMMIQPDYANGNFETAYTFDCVDGNTFTYDKGTSDEFTRTIGTMEFDVKSVNKHITSSTIGESPVWRDSFRIEPGTYEFSQSASFGCGNAVALRQNQESPLSEDGYSAANLDRTVVKDNDHLDIYLLVGDNQWVVDKKNVDAFSEWAKKNEAMRNSNGIVAGESQNSTETTAASTEVTESIDGQTTAMQSTEPSTVEPSYTAAESTEATAPVKKNTDSNLSKIVLLILILGMLFVSAKAYIAKKREENGGGGE